MKRTVVISFVVILSCIILCACGGMTKEAKQVVESQSPGATIISVEKAKSEIGGQEAVCITYQPKNGSVARMIMTEGFVITNVAQSEFTNIGCEK